MIVAWLDRSERHHEQCVEAASEVLGPLVTCEAVIAEACYLLRGVPGAPEAVLENVAGGVFQIPARLFDQAQSVRKLLAKYRDVPIDLADACLRARRGRGGEHEPGPGTLDPAHESD